MTRVKICGMRDSDSALVAAHAGADFLGFVFVEGVRRQLQPPQGKAIIERFRHEWSHSGVGPGPRLVGLFRNQPLEWVREVIEACRLDVAQLNGVESQEYGRGLRVPVLRQVRVKADDVPETLRARVRSSLDAGEMVLLDRDDPRVPGGGGVVFDWTAAEGVASLENVLLAGGLSPSNVEAALSRLSPWGVDVSSGVETDGQKDSHKIREFIARARSGDPGPIRQ